jgi:hypothetical protein
VPIKARIKSDVAGTCGVIWSGAYSQSAIGAGLIAWKVLASAWSCLICARRTGFANKFRNGFNSCVSTRAKSLWNLKVLQPAYFAWLALGRYRRFRSD